MPASARTSGCSPVQALPGGDVAVMLASARAQIGKPYRWGATGPESFDCSGLIIYAWGQAARQLTVRTSDGSVSGRLPTSAFTPLSAN